MVATEEDKEREFDEFLVQRLKPNLHSNAAHAAVYAAWRDWGHRQRWTNIDGRPKFTARMRTRQFYAHTFKVDEGSVAFYLGMELLGDVDD